MERLLTKSGVIHLVIVEEYLKLLGFQQNYVEVVFTQGKSKTLEQDKKSYNQ